MRHTKKWMTWVGLCLMTTACAQSRDVTGVVPHHYEQRHPILVGTHQRSLDLKVPPQLGMLDPAQVAEIQSFAGEYQMRGHSAIQLEVPMIEVEKASPTKGTPTKITRKIMEKRAVAQRAVDMAKQALRDAGVSGANVVMKPYMVSDANQPVIISLSFIKRGAQVATRCGQWPENMVGGEMNIQNRSPWNFGCATQQNLAAQVANPMDLVVPRHSTPISAAQRYQVISTYQKSGSGGGSSGAGSAGGASSGASSGATK